MKLELGKRYYFLPYTHIKCDPLIGVLLCVDESNRRCVFKTNKKERTVTDLFNVIGLVAEKLDVDDANEINSLFRRIKLWLKKK